MVDEAFVVEPMRVEQLDQVRRIERACFPTPWPRNAYRREIEKNERARYLVVRTSGEPGPTPKRRQFPMSLFSLGRSEARDVVGYCGVWVMLDEAHITTIAVDPDYRRLGLGQLLIIEMARIALQARATRMTLEVRMSNEHAQALYRKYGFSDGGIRPRYYSDDFEDALIMRSEDLSSCSFGERIDAGEAELRRRLTWRSRL
ncbi:MAG: ribosomal protein S18-alanine N-acetyltransferase [Chloroflexi bacterium]|nr:ribosomal protein S18-alanine N-acetyltransferase [Chloroflexota bacterium]